MSMIEEFASITGASAKEAENWLEMAGFVLADAVELFFGSGGQGGQSEQAAESSNNKPSNKRTLDQSYTRFDDEDDVRLPDQVKRQQLVDTDAYLATQNSRKITTAFSSGKRNMNEKEKTLSELFQAPLDIITQTGFDEAKEIAKRDDKWLLVNIQKDSEFQSHALNRDFWSDECVKDMVMCSFIFWQKMNITPEGETYIAYYKVHSFPHLAIIDPRTGALKWQHKFDGNSFDKKKLAEKIQDFLGDNPTPSESRGRPGARPTPFPHSTTSNNNSASSSAANASGTHSYSSSSGQSSSSNNASAEVPGYDEGEDPELAEAIQMSLQQEKAQQNQQIQQREQVSQPSSKGTTFSSAQEEKPGFSVQEILDETAASCAATSTSSFSSSTVEATIRAQFRLPGGAKGMEKFSTTEDVRNVVRAAAKLIPAADADKRFEIHFSFPRLNLSEVWKSKKAQQQEEEGGDATLSVTLADVGVAADTVFFVTYL